MNEQRPKISCDEETFDFGEKLNIESLKHSFFIRNNGNVPLLVSRIRSSCGCAVISISDKNISPGEKAELIAHISLSGRKGKLQKSIILQSNDPETPVFFLYIQGIVISEVDVIPHRLSLGNILSSESMSVTGSVVIKSEKIKPFKIVKVKTDSDYFAAESHTIKEGTAYRIDIRSKKPLPQGRFLDKILIHTDHPNYSKIEIPIMANVKKKLIVAPEEIVLPNNNNNPISRYVLIRTGTNQKFKVLSVTPPMPSIQVSIVPTAEDGYKLQFKNIIPSKELEGQNIVIKTNIEGENNIQIPFRF